jgi:hypothetical protein
MVTTRKKVYPERNKDLNRPVTSKNTESVIKVSPTKKSLGLMASLVNSINHLKN